MLVKQDLINKIKDYFDLNIYETKVWLALLAKGIASAREIAEISQVPRSRTYDVLETLERKGFAIIKIGKPVKYIGVKPRMILERLRSNIRKNSEEKINYLLRIKDSEEFSKLEEIYRKGINPVERKELSVSLKGKLSISLFLKEMIKNAKKEVVICTNVYDIKTKKRLFQQTFSFLNKSNIKIKIALTGESNLIKQIEKEFKIKIKRINIKAKFFIVDKKEVLFCISKNDADEEDIAIWINSEFFAQAFSSLFDKALKKNS